MNKEKLKEEFEDLVSEEWGNKPFGEIVCDMGLDTWSQEIADWWLSKISEEREKIKQECERLNKFEVTNDRRLGYSQALTDIITYINSLY
jgi:hypothetical protein